MSVNQNQSLWKRPPHSLASGLLGTEPTPFQDGTFNTLEIAGITTGLLEDPTFDPPFLPYACRHNKHTGSGPRRHTPSKHSMRRRACFYPPVEKAPEIDRLPLG